MKSLPDVTLVAVTSKDKEYHLRALEKSSEGIKWGAVKLLDLNTHTIDEWNRAIIYELPKYIETSHAMLIHADGYVIHPEVWKDEWLEYDYIGAPWPLPHPNDQITYRDVKGNLHRVGNSVSLRSKRLMEVAPKLNLEWKAFHGWTNEDGFICCNYRHIYDLLGMKFAPFEVALHFSKETVLPENKKLKTFAFHTPG